MKLLLGGFAASALRSVGAVPMLRAKVLITGENGSKGVRAAMLSANAISMRKSLVGSFLFALVAWPLFHGTNAAAYVTDEDVYLPPDYYTFVPPAAGGSYIDPVFGTTITRISDAANTINADSGQPLPWVEAEYSTKSPFNADNSKILVIEFSYFSLYDGVTLQRIKPLCCEGPIVSASSEPLWSRADPNVFYFHPTNPNQPNFNQLKMYNVATDVATIVHTFSEYSSISAKGESEISYDGDHIVLAGDGHQIFVYTISTDTKGPVFDTNGHGGWDAVYISPDNNVLIAWLTDGTGRYQGEELYDQNMTFLRQVANNSGHKHMTRDVDGSEVLVQTNSADPTPILNCQNGFVKINLATAQQTCLLQLDWSLSVHVTAPDQGGWVFAETYNSTAAPSPWFTYTNELLQIKLDGTEVRRLAHHRSDSSTYDGEPRISVSRDGSRFTFNSNMMGSTTDVDIAAASAGLASMSPISADPGGASFTLTVTGTNFWSDSVVQWNGSVRPTTYVSNTQLTASISALDLATEGTAQVTVFNPALGGETSNALIFTIAKKRKAQLVSE